MRSQRIFARIAAGLALAATVLAIPTVPSNADPLVDGGLPLETIVSANNSTVVRMSVTDARQVQLVVYSGSMQRDILVLVQRPADTGAPRPTLYLLDAETRASTTDALAFLGDKNTNVVMPIGGENAYWTDWRAPDPKLGVNKWETFLTAELPPIIDAALGTNGINTIAGMSRTGTSALQLAIKAPGLFRAVASYSGCAQTSDPLGQIFVRSTMQQYGGGNPDNMWGPPGDPLWAANDPFVNAAGLRGTELYISNGSGMPGAHERLDDKFIAADAGKLVRQLYAGTTLEAITNYCTHRLMDRLNEFGIPATYSFPDTGTHSWGYWEDEFKASWPFLARARGIS